MKTFRYHTNDDSLAIVAMTFSFQDDYFPESNFVIIIRNSTLSPLVNSEMTKTIAMLLKYFRQDQSYLVHRFPCIIFLLCVLKKKRIGNAKCYNVLLAFSKDRASMAKAANYNHLA